MDNPHEEKNKQRIKTAAAKGPDHPMDEIERLESIFAHFFNEEKYKVKQGEKLEHGERKKVSMLPMRTTLNIFRDPKSNGDEALKKLLKEDLGQEFELSPHNKRSFNEPNAFNNFLGASKSFVDENEIHMNLEELKNDSNVDVGPGIPGELKAIIE